MPESLPSWRLSTRSRCCKRSPSMYSTRYQPLMQPRRLHLHCHWVPVPCLDRSLWPQHPALLQQHYLQSAPHWPKQWWPSRSQLWFWCHWWNESTHWHLLKRFHHLKSDEIIHQVVEEPDILQADADIVPDDYQPDEQLSNSSIWYRISMAEDIDNLAQIRKKQQIVWCRTDANGHSQGSSSNGSQFSTGK